MLWNVCWPDIIATQYTVGRSNLISFNILPLLIIIMSVRMYKMNVLQQYEIIFTPLLYKAR